METIMIHQIFKALSQSIRLRIVIMLLDRELCVCDLIQLLQLPQSTVSRHMSRLRAAGLVIDRREGKWVHYRLAAGTDRRLDGLFKYLRSLRDLPPYGDDLANLDKYLDEKSGLECE